MKSVRQEMRERELIYQQEREAEVEKQKAKLEKSREFQKTWNEAILQKKRDFKKNKDYMGKIFTNRIRPDKKYFMEVNSPEIMVETAGVIPLSEQVRRFERAGVDLKEQMEKLYDYGTRDDNKDGKSDRIVQQYVDKIDAFELVQNAELEVAMNIRSAIDDIDAAKKQQEFDRRTEQNIDRETEGQGEGKITDVQET